MNPVSYYFRNKMPSTKVSNIKFNFSIKIYNIKINFNIFKSS